MPRPDERREGAGFADRRTRSPSLRGQPEAVDAVFQALSDPTRRALLDRLAAQRAATATELAETMPVTRQAVVKHLQSLSSAGLVAPTRQGREVHYALTPKPLGDALGWMVAVGAEWDERLERLRRRFGPTT